MLKNLVSKTTKKVIPLDVVRKTEYEVFLSRQPKLVKTWLTTSGFQPDAGKTCLVPGRDHALSRAIAVVADLSSPWGYARLPSLLPKLTFRVTTELTKRQANALALGWALGTYRFERYKKKGSAFGYLLWPRAADRRAVSLRVEAIGLCRDLINTPANDLGPRELADAGRTLSRKHQARATVIEGEQLLKRNYPAIYTVGRASSRPPLLFDMRWGQPKHRKLTLVGKGVCFDTGGLDLKPADYMRLMKKDMGGAAAILALSHMIMGAKLPVRLRVLIPAVENSVSGDAYRPLDVIQTRKGTTVEVGNTDAEGRLILCDALAEADAEDPDLIVDFATLTGAARIALGASLPALFCTDDDLADAVLQAGLDVDDPLWRLPFHRPYRKDINSPVADLSNIGSSAFGGAITAALFLREFVSPSRRYIHIDTMGYNLQSRPGRPRGGEAFGVSALAEALSRLYRRKRP